LGFIKKWLNKHLPQEYDVWQADFRQLPDWIRVGGKPVRPWVVLVTSRSHDLVLAHQMPEETPSAALLWDVLVQAMQHPAAGTPHRPTELQVRPGERWEALRPHLDEIGVGLAVMDGLDQLAAVFNELCAHVCAKPKPGCSTRALRGERPVQGARSFAGQGFLVHRLDPFTGDGGEDVAETGHQVARPEPEDVEVARVVQLGGEVEPTAPGRAEDHNLLAEVELRELVLDLPVLPEFLQGLLTGDEVRRTLLQGLVGDRPLPLLRELHGLLPGPDFGHRPGEQTDTTQGRQETEPAHENRLRSRVSRSFPEERPPGLQL